MSSLSARKARDCEGGRRSQKEGGVVFTLAVWSGQLNRKDTQEIKLVRKMDWGSGEDSGHRSHQQGLGEGLCNLWSRAAQERGSSTFQSWPAVCTSPSSF